MMIKRILAATNDEQPVLFHTAMLAALLMVANPALPLLAQGLDNPEAIDKIIDAPVATEEKAVDDEMERIEAAIANSLDNAREVRKRFTLDKVDIVFVPELAEEGSPLAEAIEQHSDAIDELRIAIEGSALFYHAVDSRSVLLRDIVAVEFSEGDDVTIFAAGEDPES